jgi:hypothetical protein
LEPFSAKPPSHAGAAERRQRPGDSIGRRKLGNARPGLPAGPAPATRPSEQVELPIRREREFMNVARLVEPPGLLAAALHPGEG